MIKLIFAVFKPTKIEHLTSAEIPKLLQSIKFWRRNAGELKDTEIHVVANFNLELNDENVFVYKEPVTNIFDAGIFFQKMFPNDTLIFLRPCLCCFKELPRFWFNQTSVSVLERCPPSKRSNISHRFCIRNFSDASIIITPPGATLYMDCVKIISETRIKNNFSGYPEFVLDLAIKNKNYNIIHNSEKYFVNTDSSALSESFSLSPRELYSFASIAPEKVCEQFGFDFVARTTKLFKKVLVCETKDDLKSEAPVLDVSYLVFQFKNFGEFIDAIRKVHQTVIVNCSKILGMPVKAVFGLHPARRIFSSPLRTMDLVLLNRYFCMDFINERIRSVQTEFKKYSEQHQKNIIWSSCPIFILKDPDEDPENQLKIKFTSGEFVFVISS